MNKTPQPPTKTYFLYADDDPDDQEFFRTMVSEIQPAMEVVLVNNGLELLQYLNHISPDGNMPCCIILDINMPIWDGIRALKALKVDEKYKNIPVIMFTTSRSSRDNDLCLMLGAQGFVTKPVSQGELAHLYNRFADACKDNIVG